MKYTVIIRQPVPDNVRGNLEKQLVERFGLNEQQAEKLAARRAGRLMKPTTQARADLLLRVFESVGAQVVLEEVREESDSPSQAFQSAGVWSAGGNDDVQLASPMRNNATMLDFTPPASVTGATGGQPVSPLDDLFGPAPSALVDPAELLPDWARKEALLAPDRKAPPPAPLNSAEAQVADELRALETAPTAPAPSTPSANDQWADFTGSLTTMTATPPPKAATDDWGDFAGGLSLPTAPADSAPRQTTEFLTAVTEDAPAQVHARTNLSQQIRLGTLLPLGLSSLLTLGLLLLAVPGLQRQLVRENARTLAATLATTLPGNAEAATTSLNSAISNSNIGFVRVEQPGGQTILRAAHQTQEEKIGQAITPWLKTHPKGGSFSANGQSYVVDRVATPGARRPGSTRYITVGLPTNLSNIILRNTLLLVALSTLIGLLLASFLAGQAARRIVQPLSELVKVADAISLGDLTRPVKVDRNDEIGDLAQALERMRLSLEAAMDRLRRRKRT
ncbi:HAMP domain-containing protein [Deinococcus sp.]|uniref:HAMP domain-containing protein n=1 Tax=Deinococcus sp. TaxID=47478 RepID=UPI0025BD3618|nr:HAMP domain-containing protein [Deinococcus sp.]